MLIQNQKRDQLTNYQYRSTFSYMSHQCCRRTICGHLWCPRCIYAGRYWWTSSFKVREWDHWTPHQSWPSYQQFAIKEQCKTVIYAELSKALHGTLQAALLFWKTLKGFIVDKLDFTINPYDWCFANKDIEEKQSTIGGHIDDLKISHVSSKVVEEIVDALNNYYGKEASTVHHRQVHDYLGMIIDYSIPGKVKFSMPTYIEELIC